MIFQRLLTGFLFLALMAPSVAWAQTGTVGQPVVAPWSVDNTDQQSRIRQYQNFKALQNQNAVSAGGKPAGLMNMLRRVDKPKGRLRGTLRPVSLPTTLRERAEPSRLEAMYSERIVDELTQFGYDLFGVPSADMRGSLNTLAGASPSMPSGAVQDNFILGEGDELEVVFTGQRSERGTYKVNSQGQLLVPDLPPIPASGRSIGQVRVSLEAAAYQLHNTQVYVSLSSVRQIGVLVIGHVKRPGRQTLTVFSYGA